MRGSRDFADRRAYEAFLQNLVAKRNQSRVTRFAADKEALRPLPSAPLGLCKEVRVNVSRFSTIQVLGNTYSVPSRLIGTRVLVRVRAETKDRLCGHQPHLYAATSAGQTPAPHRLSPSHLVDFSANLGPLLPTATARNSFRRRSSGRPTTG